MDSVHTVQTESDLSAIPIDKAALAGNGNGAIQHAMRKALGALPQANVAVPQADAQATIHPDRPTQFVHGGTDALGVARHDFSTNANACGPCPRALEALQAVNPVPYPDPQYTALVSEISTVNGIYPDRILLGASASECISRITAAVASASAPAQASVCVPAHAYGDYARAARAWGLPVVHEAAHAALIWQCEPASPTGQGACDLPEQVAALRPEQVLVLDAAYAPLRLDGHSGLGPAQRESVWQLFTPNKALGLTGVRAAYLIAPRSALDENSPAWRLAQRLRALAPSWPVGAHGVAMLKAWLLPEVQQWVQRSLDQLRAWRLTQNALLHDMGWEVRPSDSPYGVSKPPVAEAEWGAMLAFMRARGVKLRDTASMGLAGWVRLSVRPPHDQAALRDSWQAWLDAHRQSDAVLAK